MVSSKAQSVKAYLAALPPERRRALESVRGVVRKNLARGYEEGMHYGMIGWYIPLSRYPETYNGQPLSIACLASQKGYMSLYLLGAYADPKLRRWFESEYRKSGKKLDMGQSCVRFKSVDDLPLELVGEVIRRTSMDELIARYEASRGKPRPKQPAKAGSSAGPARKRAASGGVTVRSRRGRRA
jgi:hypothetical protein